MRRVLPLLLLVLLTACAGADKAAPAKKKDDPFYLKPTTFNALPGWQADNQAEALAAFTRSCARIAKKDAEKSFGPTPIAGSYRDWQAVCAKLPVDASTSPANGQGILRDGTITLTGIVYKNPEEWIIWLNGQKLYPNNLPKEIIDIKVEKDSAHIKWFDKKLYGVIAVTVRPNQQYDIETGLTQSIPMSARSFFESEFTPYEISDAEDRDGLFTGYYEPVLRGSLTKHDKYLVPLYARPDDLITVNLGDFKPELKGETITGRVNKDKLVPYFTRADIEKGAIKDEEKKIVWVDSAVDAFFLHIQGSGQVQMEDGTVLRVGYAAQNGHAYTAIGKSLLEKKELQPGNVSMQSIRQWLETHPDRAAEIMNINESYVFFRKLEGDGPLGAEGVALTPGRSLAIDKKKFPYGAPVFIDAAAPEGEGKLQRLMIAQDTGGAIRGAVRGDFFWGAGEQAAHNAGIMKSKGQAYLLLPKTATVPPEYAPRPWWMKADARAKAFTYND
ncbi:MAG TPA: MltA domain-containing protein [Patescibacteria group bacterium]|nr:MltA domain-containing protein [Patescibacteria group bacterium]